MLEKKTDYYYLCYYYYTYFTLIASVCVDLLLSGSKTSLHVREENRAPCLNCHTVMLLLTEQICFKCIIKVSSTELVFFFFGNSNNAANSFYDTFLSLLNVQLLRLTFKGAFL